MNHLRNTITTGLAAIAALLLNNSCSIRVPYGRQELPELGSALVFEQKPEEEGRTDIYELKCIEKYDTQTSMSYLSGEKFLEYPVLQPGYILEGQFIFTDSEGRICSLERLQKEVNQKTSATGYVLQFNFAVPEGERYVIHCGKTEEIVPEKKYGSYSFFDSAENGCVFSGFPETGKFNIE